MIAANPVDRVAKIKRVFRKLARGRARLSNAQQRASRARIAESADIEIKEFDLRDSVVCCAAWRGLIKREARKIESCLIQYGRGDRARPTQRSYIVVRLQGDILKRPIPTVQVVQARNISAGKEAIGARGVIH